MSFLSDIVDFGGKPREEQSPQYILLPEPPSRLQEENEFAKSLPLQEMQTPAIPQSLSKPPSAKKSELARKRKRSGVTYTTKGKGLLLDDGLEDPTTKKRMLY